MNTLEPAYKQYFRELINLVPKNLPLFRNSGMWQIRSDDMAEVLYQQEAHESFRDFLRKAVQKGIIQWDEEGLHQAEIILIDLNKRAEHLSANLYELSVQKKKLEEEKIMVDAQIDYLTRSIETIQQFSPALPLNEDWVRTGIEPGSELIPSDRRSQDGRLRTDLRRESQWGQSRPASIIADDRSRPGR
ncbi:MAG: hypothetical protein JWP57_4306 [Spirosoma sp.]|nr:hypothetical protein [Spirosoma sp.]